MARYAVHGCGRLFLSCGEQTHAFSSLPVEIPPEERTDFSLEELQKIFAESTFDIYAGKDLAWEVLLELRFASSRLVVVAPCSLC